MCLKSRRQTGGDPEGAGGSLLGSWDSVPSSSGGGWVDASTLKSYLAGTLMYIISPLERMNKSKMTF